MTKWDVSDECKTITSTVECMLDRKGGTAHAQNNWKEVAQASNHNLGKCVPKGMASKRLSSSLMSQPKLQLRESG